MDSGGLDSAQILNLLNINEGDDIVINSGGDTNSIWNILNVDSSDTFITNNNLYTTLNIDSGDQIITNSGGDSNSIWTILNVDSSDTFLTLENIDSLGLTYTDSDVIDLLNDSGVQNILPQLDSTYDLGDSARRWKDLYLSGNTIHLGDRDIQGVGNDGNGLYVDGRRLAFIDSVPDSVAGGLDSAAVITLIDSAGILDSSQITALIDSALDSIGPFYTTADHDSDTLKQVDSAYVQARVTFPVDSVGLDSVQVLALITSTVDSAYVAARDSDSVFEEYTTADHDSDTLVQVDSAYVRARVKTDQDLQTADDVTFNKVFSHFEGHTEFTARNETGGTVTAGTPVTITGISGTVPLVGLASTTTAPAFGLVHEDANNNAECLVVVSGPLIGLDTSSYAVGTVLYVDTVAGTLTDTAPSGEANNIQNIGKVLRSHATEGSILVTGAGRANAVSNLDAGQIFYGNDSNRAVPTLLTSIVDSAYVTDRVTLPSSVDFIGTVDVTTDSTGQLGDYDNGDLVINIVDGPAGSTWTGLAGDSVLENAMLVWDSADGEWKVLGGTVDYSGVDSAKIINLIDSALDSVGPFYTTADHDSDTLVQVDSAYITARADDTYVNVTGDTMTGDLVIDSGAHLTVENGGNVRVFNNGSVVSNNLNSVGNSNLQLYRNSIRKFFIGSSETIADQKVRYNSGYNRDSYTSDLVGEDSYTLMPKWYIDSATSGDYVQVAGDSMTGKLFAPAIQITQNPDDSNRSVLTFTGTDSDHSVEVIEGTVDYDLWVTSRIQDNVTWKVNDYRIFRYRRYMGSTW